VKHISLVVSFFIIFETTLLCIAEEKGLTHVVPQPAASEIEQIEDDIYRVGRVVADLKHREVILHGWVNMNSGLVEYVACSAGGKLHESMLVMDTKPRHLQAALILLGLESQGDFLFQGDPRPARGDRVSLWIEWGQAEAESRCRVEELIFDTKQQAPMEPTDWIFTGSRIYNGKYLADIEESLIATFHDPAAIINNPLEGGSDDTLYYVNSDLVPQKGTSVTVRVRAHDDSQDRSVSLSEAADVSQGRKTTFRTTRILHEDFEKRCLDPGVWKETRDGDFNECAVEIVETVRGNQCLKLTANTLGTTDPVKFLGVRYLERISTDAPKEISFDLDWNNQRNGCYLAASLYYCPVECENPKKEADWIKFEWTGVPPGQNIRTNVWANLDGALQKIHTDWGPRDENGRYAGWPLVPGRHRIKIMLDCRDIVVWVDSKQICFALHHLDFQSGYLYFQLSSGTNYPSRSIFIDNIRVDEIGDAARGGRR